MGFCATSGTACRRDVISGKRNTRSEFPEKSAPKVRNRPLSGCTEAAARLGGQLLSVPRRVWTSKEAADRGLIPGTESDDRTSAERTELSSRKGTSY